MFKHFIKKLYKNNIEEMHNEIISLRYKVFTMQDGLKQIEWRLAMCRSITHDIQAAHNIVTQLMVANNINIFNSSVTREKVKIGK